MDASTLRQRAAATGFAAGLALMALLRVFSPTQVGLALGLWLLASAALTVATVGPQGVAHAALGALGGLSVVALVVLALGHRSLSLSDGERTQVLPAELQSSAARWEYKLSAFHTDSESSADDWSYRAFYARRRDDAGVTVFYVVQSSRDEAVPARVTAVSSAFWRLPI